MTEEINASDSDKLVFRLMTEKINTKYSHLSSEEREIISNYVFFSSQNKDYLKTYLNEKRERAIDLLEDFEDREKNSILIEKVDRVRSTIEKLDTDAINDSSIVKFLTVTKLIKELTSSEKRNV